jgi:hypothetical protein
MNALAVKWEIRPLNIDFDLHTDNDPVFKKEFCGLLIGNLNELNEDLHTSVQQNDSEIFKKARHKAAVSIDIINDQSLLTGLTIVKAAMDAGDTELLTNTMAQLDTLLGELIHALETEAQQ